MNNAGNDPVAQTLSQILREHDQFSRKMAAQFQNLHQTPKSCESFLPMSSKSEVISGRVASLMTFKDFVELSAVRMGGRPVSLPF